MTTHGPFTFDTENDADCQRFDFTSTNGGGGQTSGVLISGPGTAAEFCHDTNGGNSAGTGPSQGQGGVGDGYLYTECSNPGANNDEYTMTFDTILDASAEQWQFNFYRLCCGNTTLNECLSTIEVQINENSGGWVTVATIGGTGDTQSSETDWQSESVDLSESGVNTDSSTEVRLLITTQTATQVYYGDVGIDTVEIVGTALADIEQEGYRFYDDGTESGSSARQNQDTVDSIAKGITFQTRVLLNATGDPGSEQYQLEYKEASDGAAENRKVPLT